MEIGNSIEVINIINILFIVVIFILQLILNLKAKRMSVKLVPLISMLILYLINKNIYGLIGSLLAYYTYILYTSIQIVKITSKVKGIIKLTILGITLYLLQFIVFPLITPSYYPITLESSIVLLGTTILESIVLVIISKGVYKFRKFMIFITAYIILVGIYSGQGYYGIGYTGKILEDIHFDKLTALKQLPILWLGIGGLNLPVQLIFSGIRDIVDKTMLRNVDSNKDSSSVFNKRKEKGVE